MMTDTVPRAASVEGPMERLLLLRQALSDAGYPLDPDQKPLQPLLERVRRDRPGAVALVFLGRDLPLRCMVLADQDRVQLRCAFHLRARAIDCQAWNREHLFTKATVDQDGDLALQYDYPLVGPIDLDQFKEVARLFTMSAAAAATWFRDRRWQSRAVDASRVTLWMLAAWGLFTLVRAAIR